MYYGLFVKVGRRYIRVDTTTGYTIDTAKHKFSALIAILRSKGLRPELRELSPVKLLDAFARDKKYARSLI